MMESKLTAQDARDIRAQLGLTQEQMAITMGVRVRTIARWEASGKVPKTAATLMRLLITMTEEGL